MATKRLSTEPLQYGVDFPKEFFLECRRIFNLREEGNLNSLRHPLVAVRPLNEKTKQNGYDKPDDAGKCYIRQGVFLLESSLFYNMMVILKEGVPPPLDTITGIANDHRRCFEELKNSQDECELYAVRTYEYFECMLSYIDDHNLEKAFQGMGDPVNIDFIQQLNGCTKTSNDIFELVSSLDRVMRTWFDIEGEKARPKEIFTHLTMNYMFKELQSSLEKLLNVYPRDFYPYTQELFDKRFSTDAVLDYTINRFVTIMDTNCLDANGILEALNADWVVIESMRRKPRLVQVETSAALRARVQQYLQLDDSYRCPGCKIELIRSRFAIADDCEHFYCHSCFVNRTKREFVCNFCVPVIDEWISSLSVPDRPAPDSPVPAPDSPDPDSPDPAPEAEAPPLETLSGLVISGSGMFGSKPEE